ncbi:MAG TPA: S41 family peptidase [Gemmatimonadaceae bacterium]|nr:S41 family peptidase [Gemmatimonadaceae bacterium]
MTTFVMRGGRVCFGVLIATFSIATSFARAQSTDTTRPPIRARSVVEDLQMFSQVLNQIRVNHPDSVETHILLMAAVEGMVRAADPHSFVIPAMRLDPAREAAWEEGKLFPVPVAFRFIGGDPVVVSVAAGSRASALDILPGDELIAIDHKPVAATSANELEISLAGSKGAPVVLSFERRRLDGSIAHIDRKVQREKVDEASAVPTAFMLDERTGYVRITSFLNDRVADDLHDALGQLEARGMRRLVLDLRDNPGGRIDQAARIAGEFLPKGAIVYTSTGEKREMIDTSRVSRSFWRSERRYPIVLMTNAGTASAAELLAGALQDHDRALIVGKPTFGKALIMRGFPLSDGSIIELVVGHLKTPCGRVVQRQYRSITTREYYRLARADRDTAGRPNCRTDAGRVAYGGGGIYPDLVVDESDIPLWLARLGEDNVVLKWIGGYVTANPSVFASLDALSRSQSIDANGITEFRKFAATQGITIPQTAEADTTLERVLSASAARSKFGDAGFYRISAALDPEVQIARRAFDDARFAFLVAPASSK